jgi:uncharacterized protein
MSNPSGTSDTKLDRRALILFLCLAACFSMTAYIPIIRSGTLNTQGGVLLLLMWSPGLAGAITAGVMFRSVRSLGLIGNRKLVFWSILCLLLPVAYTLVIYPVLGALGLVSLGNANIGMGFFILGLLSSLLLSFGEELGWRGFAAPVIGRAFGFWLGQTLLGIVWFVYHLPLFLLTDYGQSSHMIFGNTMFLISVISLSYFLGWVRQQSESVWPCAFFHASHNLIFLHLFDPMRLKNSASVWLVGEQGLLIALVLASMGVYALVANRGHRPCPSAA